MIGKIYKTLAPFYDTKSKSMSFKHRPALVIAMADSDDVVVLPISSITHRQNIHPSYDVQIDPSQYPKLMLKKVSYVRTHKQLTIHKKEVSSLIADLRSEYPDLYLDILIKREAFSQDVSQQAMIS